MGGEKNELLIYCIFERAQIPNAATPDDSHSRAVLGFPNDQLAHSRKNG